MSDADPCQAMTATIPVYQLNTLTETATAPAAVFFLGPNSAPPHLPIDLPYRSNYYKIGICLRGSARLKVNLETYEITPNSLMVLSPYVIKQWPFMSADCDALSIFFTKEFSAVNGARTWMPSLSLNAMPATCSRCRPPPPRASRPCCKPSSRSASRPTCTGKKFCVVSFTFYCTNWPLSTARSTGRRKPGRHVAN